MQGISALSPPFFLPQRRSRIRALFQPSRDWITTQILLGDWLVMTAALTVAIGLRAILPITWARSGFFPRDYFDCIVLGPAIYLLLLELNMGYHKAVFFTRKDAFLAIIKASLWWGGVVLLLTRALGVHNTMSRLFVFEAVVCSFLFMLGWRMALRHVLCRGETSPLKDRILVVGWSRETHRLFEQIKGDPSHPYELIGCTPSAHGKFWVVPPQELPVLGDYNGIKSFLREHRPDRLILGDLDPVMGEIIALSQLCVKENVHFMVIPSYFQLFASGLHLESISGVPLMGVSRLPLDSGLHQMLKRLVDIIGALLGLLLSLPLIIIFGYLVWRESPGPIFYKADRMGFRGRKFKMYKIRSMRLDAGVQRAVANDNRRLKIGIFMRNWNIDEVPQFWNVLMGDMSLVGPRPEILGLVDDLKEQIQFYNARHSVKPGMTGWAQIHGWRGDTDLTERLRVDLYYQENWTLFLDFYIMAMTFRSRKNAY